eukprot:3825216-Prorocentrum_lima.AAC.1
MIRIENDLHHLQQDFTGMRNNMASEITVLEASIPNDKELKRMETCITEISGEIKEMKKGLKGQERYLDDL